MERLPQNDVLQFHTDTLSFLRKQYNLENPKRMNETIDILEEWLKKQDHFIKKQYPRDYLERAIILGKGSIEKVKNKLDMLSTYKTLSPRFFELFDADVCRESNMLVDTLLPKMTPDHYRVYILKVTADEIPSDNINFFRCFISICEYIHTYDYCNGIILIFDYTDASIIEIVKTLDILEVQQVLKILVEGFGLRLKGLHLITPSKVANIIITFFKQATSAKIGQRIFLHKNIESLCDVIPREILPSDYNGYDKPLRELHVNLVDALSSKEFAEHLHEMGSACTNEDLRRKDKFNNEFMGVPGTFRSLCLD